MCPKAIIQGRHLTALSLTPGKYFFKIHLKIYFAQLNGDFATEEDGLLYAQKLMLMDKNLTPTQPDYFPTN
jgi:hypothetical protein